MEIKCYFRSFLILLSERSFKSLMEALKLPLSFPEFAGEKGKIHLAFPSPRLSVSPFFSFSTDSINHQISNKDIHITNS